MSSLSCKEFYVKAPKDFVDEYCKNCNEGEIAWKDSEHIEKRFSIAIITRELHL